MARGRRPRRLANLGHAGRALHRRGRDGVVRGRVGGGGGGAGESGVRRGGLNLERSTSSRKNLLSKILDKFNIELEQICFFGEWEQ